MDLAKERLRHNFAFIGLTEAWETSVCLFHRQFGGAMHPNEVANLRPAEIEHYAETFRVASHADMQELTIEDDPYDYEIYVLARQLFIERLQRYGLMVPPRLSHPPDIWS